MDSAQLTREDSIRSVAHEACANNLDAAKLYADQGLLPGFDFDGEVDLAYSAAQGYVGQLGVCEDRVEGAQLAGWPETRFRSLRHRLPIDKRWACTAGAAASA